MNETESRLENMVRVFHEDCGGIAVGEPDDLHCAECGKLLELAVVEKVRPKY